MCQSVPECARVCQSVPEAVGVAVAVAVAVAVGVAAGVSVGGSAAGAVGGVGARFLELYGARGGGEFRTMGLCENTISVVL